MQEMIRQQNELQDATFAPRVSENPFPLQNFKPIQERFKEVQQFKEQMLLNLRKKFEATQDMTFKPNLDKETEKIAMQRNKGKDVLERIQEEATDIVRKKLMLQKLEDAKISEQCTFQPNIYTYINEEVAK
jgi:hypothetical protein